jgi:hypothetical protein
MWFAAGWVAVCGPLNIMWCVLNLQVLQQLSNSLPTEFLDNSPAVELGVKESQRSGIVRNPVATSASSRSVPDWSPTNTIVSPPIQ